MANKYYPTLQVATTLDTTTWYRITVTRVNSGRFWHQETCIRGTVTMYVNGSGSTLLTNSTNTINSNGAAVEIGHGSETSAGTRRGLAFNNPRRRRHNRLLFRGLASLRHGVQRRCTQRLCALAGGFSSWAHTTNGFRAAVGCHAVRCSLFQPAESKGCCVQQRKRGGVVVDDGSTRFWVCIGFAVLLSIIFYAPFNCALRRRCDSTTGWNKTHTQHRE